MNTGARHPARVAARSFLLPLLVSLYPVVFLYAHNVEYLRLRQILVPAAGAILLALAATALCHALLKHPLCASLSAAGFVFLFWNYDPVFQALNPADRLHHWHGIPLALVLYAHAVAALHRFRDHPLLPRLARALALAAALLVGFNLASLLQAESAKTRAAAAMLNPFDSPASESPSPDHLPDVYFLLFDEYARFDTIQNAFGHDNLPFAEFLEARGFFVAHESTSRFEHSAPVLASLHGLGWVEPGLPEHELYARIRNSRLFDLLDRRGYQITYLDAYSRPGFRSAHPRVQHDYIHDLHFGNRRSLDEFSLLIVQRTLLGPLAVWLARGNSNQYFQCALHFFDTISNLPFRLNRDDRPHFLLAHILCPHLPFVFDRHGRFAENPTNHWEYENLDPKLLKALYLDQFIYLTQRIQGIVKDLLERSERPPVIVLCSDHGPRMIVGGPDNIQHLGVLNAVFFPDGRYDRLTPASTTVDTLQILLDQYIAAPAPPPGEST